MDAVAQIVGNTVIMVMTFGAAAGFIIAMRKEHDWWMAVTMVTMSVGIGLLATGSFIDEKLGNAVAMTVIAAIIMASALAFIGHIIPRGKKR
jgi:drug/metabolite transporter (DMT)-like permease